MGKGGGGGSLSVPKIKVPKQVGQVSEAAGAVGQFGTSLFSGLGNMVNWASDIATGGNVEPVGGWGGLKGSVFGADPTEFATFTGSDTPGTLTFGQAQGTGGTAGEFDPINANAWVGGDSTWGAGGGGGGFTGMVSDPGMMSMDQWQSYVTSNGEKAQYNPQTNQYRVWNAFKGDWGQTLDYSKAQQPGQGYSGLTLAPTPEEVAQMKNTAAATQAAQMSRMQQERGGIGSGPGGGRPSLLGPFLGQAWNATEMLPGMIHDTQAWTQHESNLAAGLDKGQLTDTQKAYIDQATQSEKTAIASQLAAEGMGSSTSNAILQGEAEQQGAATAGQLVQGNIALGQVFDKLALGGQELTLAEQTSLEGQAADLQKTTWSEAMQGLGMLGQMMQTVLSAYGVDLQGLSQYTQASIAQAQIQAQLEEAQLSAANQASSSAGSGLGSLFSGIGSLFGGGAAAAGGLGAVGGASGAVAEIAPLVAGLAFCAVAREVYGLNNPKWMYFRDWMLRSAPAWMRRFYERHMYVIASWLRNKPVSKAIVRFFMDFVAKPPKRPVGKPVRQKI